MVGYFGVVYRMSVQRILGEFQGVASELGMELQRVQQRGDLSEEIFWNVPASGSRIGNQLCFVEILGNVQCLFGREAVASVGISL